jgi:hypothetical protein
VPHFTEDNLHRIIINPFYAITVASQWTKEHEPPMGEAEWVQANASLMGEIGAERWLRQLLDVLEGKSKAPDGPVNPYRAVNIDPLFATAHPALIERDMWIDVNVMQLRSMGSEGWLRQLLDVLGGDRQRRDGKRGPSVRGGIDEEPVLFRASGSQAQGRDVCSSARRQAEKFRV